MQVYGRKKAAYDRHFFLFSVGAKAALVCLSLYTFNLLFPVTCQLTSLSWVLNNVMAVLSKVSVSLQVLVTLNLFRYLKS